MKDHYSILNQISAELVLDAATGRGDFIHVLKQNLRSYVQIIGVDASDKMVDFAQRSFPENDVEIYQMDLEALSYEDASFDLVCLSNSLHHIRDLDAVLQELLRVLKPGGTLLINEMYCDGEQSEPQKTHILMHHWLAAIDSRGGTFHQSTYPRQKIMDMVKKLRLQKLKVDDFYEPVDNPKDARNCASLQRNLAETLKRVETMPDNEELLAEGMAILERINTVGCASPSRLLILGVKPAPKTKGEK